MFSTDVLITSTDITSPRKVIKVMYQESSNRIGDLVVIKLEDDIVIEIQMELERVRSHMVQVAGMGKWNVGYLGKY